ncbi:hypothetical protein [Streptomyces rhizosphaericus]|uniref:Uncharacterized protein n=1 Tax=Streptomyces rhizosphaericus TaxID=114699 RepID=A0ABN1SVE3_9ACTN
MRWVRDNLVLLLGLAVLVYTFVPIAVVVLMSFNAPDSRLVYSFDGFTFDNWLNPCADPDLCSALGVSIRIGALATLASSALAGFDHVHFLAQEQRSRGTDIRNEDLWLGDAHAVLADAWDLDGDQRSAVLRGYLLEVNLRFVRDRQLDDAPPARAGWARELVERLTGPPQR